MPDDILVETLRHMLQLSLTLAMPILGTALLIGLIVGLLQAVTSIQEQTLAFVPKLLGISAVLVILGHWMVRTMVDYTAELLAGLPRFGAL